MCYVIFLQLRSRKSASRHWLIFKISITSSYVAGVLAVGRLESKLPGNRRHDITCWLQISILFIWRKYLIILSSTQREKREAWVTMVASSYSSLSSPYFQVPSTIVRTGENLHHPQRQNLIQIGCSRNRPEPVSTKIHCSSSSSSSNQARQRSVAVAASVALLLWSNPGISGQIQLVFFFYLSLCSILISLVNPVGPMFSFKTKTNCWLSIQPNSYSRKVEEQCVALEYILLNAHPFDCCSKSWISVGSPRNRISTRSSITSNWFPYQIQRFDFICLFLFLVCIY